MAIFEPLIPVDRINDICRQLNFEAYSYSVTNKIWLFWRHGLRLSVISSSEQYLHAEVGDRTGGFLCFVTAIYARSTRSDRLQLWSDLQHLGTSITRPWVLGGDFNAITSLSEYQGRSTPELQSIGDFSSFISDCGLLHLPTTGGPFTWTRVRSMGRVWKRLDRVFVNLPWLSTTWRCSVDILSRTTSDHSPLLLQVDLQNANIPRPFRLQHF